MENIELKIKEAVDKILKENPNITKEEFFKKFWQTKEFNQVVAEAFVGNLAEVKELKGKIVWKILN